MLSGLIAISIVALCINPATAATVKYAGVNIAGFDFGCDTYVSSSLPLRFRKHSLTKLPGRLQPERRPGDGPSQMTHFTRKDGLNILRLPVGWQYLVNNNLDGPLDAGNFDQYNRLIEACLTTGATCIIDVHNYARWNGQVIGQPGGPTRKQFTKLWRQLARKYKEHKRVAFGLMNEPHDCV